MDGTLYDSMPGHARAWMIMTAGHEIDAREEEFFMYEGRTGASIIDLLVRRTWGRPATEAEKHDLYAEKARLFAAMPPVEVMAGAPEMVQVLMQAGVRPVLVTGSGQNTLLSRLDRDFPGAFTPDMRVTSRNVSRGKPDPEPYLMALSMAGVTASEAIVVENAPLGVESGHRAGIYTVAVATGPVPADALWEAGADAVFDSMISFAAALRHGLADIHS